MVNKKINYFYINKYRYVISSLLILMSDFIALSISYSASILVSYYRFGYINFERDIKVFSALISMLIIAFFIKGHYNKRIPLWSEIKSIIIISSCIFLFNATFLFLLKVYPSRTGLVVTWMASIVFIPVFRSIVRKKLIKLKLWTVDTVIIGDGENAIDTARALEAEHLLGYKIIAFFSLKKLNKTKIEVSGIDYPVIKLDESPEKQLLYLGNPHIVIALEKEDLEKMPNFIGRLNLSYPSISVVPALRGLPLFGAEIHYMFRHEVMFLDIKNNLRTTINCGIKRIFDVILSSFLLILLSPILFFIIFKIRKTGGKAIFGHERVGRDGRKFQCLKFRTMVENSQEVLEELLNSDLDANAEWYASFKLKNDPRVTPFGKFLRKTSLDELPQLWNVLRGDMSLVGPRPVIEDELPLYGENVVYYKQAKPGITGLWQVSGRSDIDYSNRIFLDAWYVKNWSLWMDIVILINTGKVVLCRNGAY